MSMPRASWNYNNYLVLYTAKQHNYYATKEPPATICILKDFLDAAEDYKGRGNQTGRRFRKIVRQRHCLEVVRRGQ
jgi:hypothetical protein